MRRKVMFRVRAKSCGLRGCAREAGACLKALAMNIHGAARPYAAS
jgi:hypothetical protein